MRGKFIVLDGTDGSGKGTQFKLLVKKLKQEGFSVRTVDFPQYGKKSAGLVEEYLNGKFGTAEEVGPYCASIFYACDRYAVSFQIKKWLSEGKVVVANRYVSANMGHQGGKIDDIIQRKKYFAWLDNLEYKIFQIPKPDLVIILHVPAEVAQRLVDKKVARDYIGGKKRDIHENDLQHLKKAEQVYLQMAEMFVDMELLECGKDKDILPIKDIQKMLWLRVKKILSV